MNKVVVSNEEQMRRHRNGKKQNVERTSEILIEEQMTVNTGKEHTKKIQREQRQTRTKTKQGKRYMKDNWNSKEQLKNKCRVHK